MEHGNPLRKKANMAKWLQWLSPLISILTWVGYSFLASLSAPCSSTQVCISPGEPPLEPWENFLPSSFRWGPLPRDMPAWGSLLPPRRLLATTCSRQLSPDFMLTLGNHWGFLPYNQITERLVGWLGCFYSAYPFSSEKNISMREQLTYYITQMQFGC